MNGAVDFQRNWNEYKHGFGDLNSEFFLGLEKTHELTADISQELLVILEDHNGNEAFETYEEFGIGNGDQQYVLHTLGRANGTANDSLSYHRGMQFTTFDVDNDRHFSINCAEKFSGGWWYNSCQDSKLTGKYADHNVGMGVNWYAFRGAEYSLKRAVMMIRPRK
ncbi:ficolin-1-like [Drosophila innubila]|uniref:ficolin-1-like n=1 Tax=Drosophila innubila TaxID=198719 RepID=UPI00148BB6E6|nr:ficolin-1-like [Drosophila innubila]